MALEVYSRQNPDLTLTITPQEGDSLADVVINKDLANRSSSLSPLTEKWLNQSRLKELLIPSAWERLEKSGYKHIPLAFDVPLILYSRKDSPQYKPLALTMDSFQQRAEEFDRSGYNPLWQPEYLDHFLNSYGADFQTQGNFIQWDPSSLSTGLEKIDSFFHYPKDYYAKHFIEHPYNLLLKGRIHFWVISLEEWLNLPEKNKRESLFYFLSSEEAIQSLPGTLEAGLTLKGADNPAAEDFLIWLTRSENQIDLLQNRQRNLDLIRGVFGGLSTIQESNQYLRELYPGLRQQFPQGEDFRLSSPLPQNWESFKENALIPWLETENQEKTEKAFSDLVQNWLKSQLN